MCSKKISLCTEYPSEFSWSKIWVSIALTRDAKTTQSVSLPADFGVFDLTMAAYRQPSTKQKTAKRDWSVFHVGRRIAH